MSSIITKSYWERQECLLSFSVERIEKESKKGRAGARLGRAATVTDTKKKRRRRNKIYPQSKLGHVLDFRHL
jgi:hypothetical protein